MSLLPEDLLILSCVKVSPTQSELDQINELVLKVKDWDYFAGTAIDHQAGPLLYRKIPLLSNKTMIPKLVQAKLQQAWLRTLSRSMIIIDHFKKISEVFKENGIPFIAMKGILLADWLYKETGLRQFSDMDLLVRVKDGKRCLDILGEMGYIPAEYEFSKFVKENSEIVHYPPMVKNGVSVEIHIKIHSDAEQYHVDIANFWNNARSVTVHGVETLMFDCNDLLLHLCLHLDKHFCAGRIQFTCIYDITNLLDQHAAEIDWDRFKESCKRYEAISQTYPYIILAAKYLNAPVPESVKEEFASLLNARKERVFLQYWGNRTFINKLPGLFRNLRNLKSPLGSLRFLIEMIFPPKAFMVHRYHIRNKSLAYFYYPYRILLGFKAVCISVVNSFR